MQLKSTWPAKPTSKTRKVVSRVHFYCQFSLLFGVLTTENTSSVNHLVCLRPSQSGPVSCFRPNQSGLVSCFRPSQSLPSLLVVGLRSVKILRPLEISFLALESCFMLSNRIKILLMVKTKIGAFLHLHLLYHTHFFMTIKCDMLTLTKAVTLKITPFCLLYLLFLDILQTTKNQNFEVRIVW